MTGNEKSHVFTLQNINEFEKSYLKFIGFGCPGVTLGPNSSKFFLNNFFEKSHFYM